MVSRRDFVKKAGLLAGTLGLYQTIPQSIQAALKIDPAEGSTYLDAEHIVMVMQENRSFDHSFGTLRGVRGFNDPRIVRLRDGRPGWLQSYHNGHTYAPFRMDIKNSNAAWTKDLPHAWENQISAWNEGKYDNWLEAKRSGNKRYRDIPLTLGYYTREDIPFYYAFADAFTICDQHFCSSLTGTTTNRHFFWTGKCVPEEGAKPLVRNSDTYYNREAAWRTFPELLEANKVSWKVYQNELSLQNSLTGAAVGWLGNFTDNNLEWFSQYHVRYKKSHIEFYTKRTAELPREIAELENQLKSKHDQKLQQQLKQKKEQLISFQKELAAYSSHNFSQLDPFNKALHERAFQTNEGDPYYHEVETIDIDGEKIVVPKGDVLHQFRRDVQTNKLPTISWLVAPQNFSDHPSAPMYGAWYVSEILNILTENPEVWKKTIFILNYDENDGYYDHIPPFVAPKPGDNKTGTTSEDLDYSSEFVTKEQELSAGISEKYATEGPVGLGYRVPLIIASPWSRGGWVNSEVCDITSTIQFIEHFLDKKYDIHLREDNISSWRRAITGDLTSVFRPFHGEVHSFSSFLDRNEQVALINKSRDMPVPNGYHRFSEEEIVSLRKGGDSQYLPRQESGIKPSNALNYELYVQERRVNDTLEMHFVAANNLFGTKSLAGVFNVYAYGYNEPPAYWSFATSAGRQVDYAWDINQFSGDKYAFAVHGPNGFYRFFAGQKVGNPLHINQSYDLQNESFILEIGNLEDYSLKVLIFDYYSNKRQSVVLNGKENKRIILSTKKQSRWYDIEVTITSRAYMRRYCGRIENGKDSITDPIMGRVEMS